MIRIGQGIDVHAFYDKKLDAQSAKSEPNQFVTLAGVKIEHSHSLLAHSDGDVVLHALADALLGALALGDIGQHFPDTDDANSGLDSRVLLRHVYDLILQKGYSLVNADITVMCERPKLAKHNMAMRLNIAQDLQTHVDNISVKATTTEKLGFTGRQEGIMASAVVLLTKQV
ncbi:2-C-methyl-D-erythritol 2,4-cyclodiphosphate synthase [Psychrobacter sp. YP14]|jgi:2-C-methyl-D-erythritol 2,4-cyclodiphosphate synthase|uniref:2-C-methyl-D-erythritol 2,4-cyclodiphosphate synthase n=1 Tax=Psychrobacter raelei TaxID=2565531 RepID=A0AAT9PH08_9GAMM|nr:MULTISPECIES: 2-C-methyl-D-erythritol 2,4-cyclodiphosphate synthase [unclassified Psychrobacter]AWT48928.1 2-C-methyl-D-erythritol 2,4-cyclodiphosphate synthase [Psychrobacter sp. YP14]UNK06223.1 2-C-methyl-D-erythritol 2,4-cyclodiphosphate synthase [Psychrobacter sp. PraFG1]